MCGAWLDGAVCTLENVQAMECAGLSKQEGRNKPCELTAPDPQGPVCQAQSLAFSLKSSEGKDEVGLKAVKQ